MDYAFNEVSNYKRNTIKITPQNKNSYQAGEICTFVLPSNALLDLATFRVHFDVALAGTGTNTIALPKDIESLLERVQCSSKGVNIENGFNNYNLLFKTLLNITCDQSVQDGQRSVYSNAQATAKQSAGNAGYKFTIEKWLGFLGSANVIATSNAMLPDFHVDLTFTNNNVLIQSGTTKDATYTVQNIYATIDVIQGSEFLEMALSSVRQKPMIAFDNYANYSDTKNSVKFGINSAHLNKVLVVVRPTTFSTQADTDATVDDSVYFKCSRQACDNHQLSIGDSLYPNYQASGYAYADVIKAFGKQRDISVGSLISSKTIYEQSRYCLAYNFEHLGSSVLSGLDTRGIAQSATWEAQQLSANSRVDVFPIMKSVLMIDENNGIMVQP